jgi:RNA polymerase sigma factor (sigma-70 family)
VSALVLRDILLRDLAPQVLAILLRRYHDFAAAEDATQEALLAAAKQWPVYGTPENPRAWLLHVAMRRMTDQIRSDIARRRREADMLPSVSESEQEDSLMLILMCCHPALTSSSAIALTLRAVGGLTTAETARAFLVPEPTMAQRISRAKQTIKGSRIPFEMPATPDYAARLRTALHVIYLIFNEGYTASSGDMLQRHDLAAEAIRLARLLPVSGHPEIAGLLSLMLLTDARRNARSDALGTPVPLDRQDRALWNRAQIAEGVALLTVTLPKGAIGPYRLQAAIAAVHCEATDAAATDWPQIAALYSLLLRLGEDPVVRLNHAVAVAMVKGPLTGLQILRSLESDPRLREHHRFYAVRGHLHEMAGDYQSAIQNYQLAAARTASLPERNYLIAQAARLTP